MLTIESDALLGISFHRSRRMIFKLTVAAVCVAILLLAIAIFRHLVWLGKKRKPGQSLFLLDSITSDERPGKPRKRRP